MRFSFTGDISLNATDSNNPYYKTGSCKNGNPWSRFGMAVASSKNNRAYLEIMGSVQDTIKTMNTDNDKIEISWNDRTDESVLKSIPGYKKHVVNIEDGRYEFLADYDFVEFLNKNAEALKTGKYTVTGQTEANVYNGKVSQRFKIQNIYLANEDAKDQLRVTTEYFFNKDSFDFADWREEKIITINGYISTYISSERKNMYVEHPIVFDCSKIDFENEKHVKIVKAKLSLIGCTLDDDNKPKCSLKSGKCYSMAVILGYVNGSERVEFTEAMLTPKQREMYELGIKKLEDFRPEGDVYGERKTIYKLLDFDLNTVNKVNYSDGYVTMELTEDEFDEEIFKPAKEEKEEDVLEEKPKSPMAEPLPDDGLEEDLFG